MSPWSGPPVREKAMGEAWPGAVSSFSVPDSRTLALLVRTGASSLRIGLERETQNSPDSNSTGEQTHVLACERRALCCRVTFAFAPGRSLTDGVSAAAKSCSTNSCCPTFTSNAAYSGITAISFGFSSLMPFSPWRNVDKAPYTWSRARMTDPSGRCTDMEWAGRKVMTSSKKRCRAGL